MKTRENYYHWTRISILEYSKKDIKFKSGMFAKPTESWYYSQWFWNNKEKFQYDSMDFKKSQTDRRPSPGEFLN